MDKLVFIFEPTGSYSSLLKYFCANKKIKAFIPDLRPKSTTNT